MDELVELWHQLEIREGQIDEGASIFDYIEVDEDVATSVESTLEEIVQRVAERIESEDESSGEGERKYIGTS